MGNIFTNIKQKHQDRKTQRLFDNVTKSLLTQNNGLKRDPETGIPYEDPLKDEHPGLDLALTWAQPGNIVVKALAPSMANGIVEGIRNGNTQQALLSMLIPEGTVKNLIGRRLGAQVDSKYTGLPILEQDELIFDDFLEGRKLASDFFSSDIKKLTDLKNKQLAESLGYEFVENKDAVSRINKPMVRQRPDLWLQRNGYGGFYLNRDLALQGVFGRYKPNSDEMILTGIGDIQEVSMHEHLHRGNFGEAPWHPTQSPKEYNALRSTDNFYQKLTDDIIDPTKPYNDYIGTPGEAATNLLETGRRANLTLGQPYPEEKAATKIFEEIIENDSFKGPLLDKFKWKQEPKKIWDALTGAYYAAPIIGLTYGATKQ